MILENTEAVHMPSPARLCNMAVALTAAMNFPACISSATSSPEADWWGTRIQRCGPNLWNAAEKLSIPDQICVESEVSVSYETDEIDDFSEKVSFIRAHLEKHGLSPMWTNDSEEDCYTFECPGNRDACVELYADGEVIVSTRKLGVDYIRELLIGDTDIMIQLINDAPLRV